MSEEPLGFPLLAGEMSEGQRGIRNRTTTAQEDKPSYYESVKQGIAFARKIARPPVAIHHERIRKRLRRRHLPPHARICHQDPRRRSRRFRRNVRCIWASDSPSVA